MVHFTAAIIVKFVCILGEYLLAAKIVTFSETDEPAADFCHEEGANAKQQYLHLEQRLHFLRAIKSSDDLQ